MLNFTVSIKCERVDHLSRHSNCNWFSMKKGTPASPIYTLTLGSVQI